MSPNPGLTPAETELRDLLREQGILYAEPARPVLDRNGEPAEWMFYSWNVSLTGPGARLAARCLLDRLEGFEATQLATYGQTAIPLLSSCIVLGDGKYTGLCIRDAPKGHGSGRQIEGPADRSRPVVLVDDSLSSGRSALAGIRVLEAEGLEVEGVVCLVRFPHRGGRERLRGLGYRVDALFDIWDDLEMPRPSYVAAWKRVGKVPWAANRVEDGLHPAAAARRVAAQYLAEGTVPLPPLALDEQYNAAGGTYVSLRARETDVRLARDGFWHFEPSESDAARDVVLATAKMLMRSNILAKNLEQLKIAVSFFSALEEIGPAQLDFSRFGIVVRSRDWPTKVGGALPNTQVFTSEIEQYDLALRNARIGQFEPHELYRHEVHKVVEPGAGWLRFGVPNGPELDWTSDDAVGRTLTDRAHAVMLARARGDSPPSPPLDEGLVPGGASGIAVTLYLAGRVIGCFASSSATVDESIVRATHAAMEDQRFRGSGPSPTWNDVVPAVAIFHDREWIGTVASSVAARKLRLGLDSLTATSGKQRGLFLASVATHRNWSKETFARNLLEKVGIAGDVADWSTYRTATWLYSDAGPIRQMFGFADRRAADSRSDALLLGRHLAVNADPQTGLPTYAQSPVEGERWTSGTAARLLHALGALHEAGSAYGEEDWIAIARRGLQTCLEHLGQGDEGTVLRLPGHRGGSLADCELLYALCASDLHLGYPAVTDRLIQLAAKMLRPDGSIAPQSVQGRYAADHDFLPGAVLVSLAEAASRGRWSISRDRLDRHLDWYTRRFQNVHPWGLVAWQMQAWARFSRLAGARRYADFVFDLADWALTRQLDCNGAFLTDLNPTGPSFHTAFVAEGIADAWSLAEELGELERAARYRQSWERATQFVSRLVIGPEDAPCLADARRAVGGVRGTLDTSFVRVDFVSHALAALTREPRQAERVACDSALIA